MKEIHSCQWVWFALTWLLRPVVRLSAAQRELVEVVVLAEVAPCLSVEIGLREDETCLDGMGSEGLSVLDPRTSESSSIVRQTRIL